MSPVLFPAAGKVKVEPPVTTLPAVEMLTHLGLRHGYIPRVLYSKHFGGNAAYLTVNLIVLRLNVKKALNQHIKLVETESYLLPLFLS